MLLDELRAEGDKLEWYPIGLRGSEERMERWLFWYAGRDAMGAPPRRLFEMAERQVRGQPMRDPPGRDGDLRAPHRGARGLRMEARFDD
jgi:hypothetical protein